MSAYEGRRLMLDSGLTALALRAVQQREGHYPFIEPVTRGRRGRRRTTRVGGAGSWRPFLAFLSRWQPAAR